MLLFVLSLESLSGFALLPPLVDKMGQDKHDDMYRHIIECVLTDNRMQSKEGNEDGQ